MNNTDRSESQPNQPTDAERIGRLAAYVTAQGRTIEEMVAAANVLAMHGWEPCSSVFVTTGKVDRAPILHQPMFNRQRLATMKAEQN